MGPLSRDFRAGPEWGEQATSAMPLSFTGDTRNYSLQHHPPCFKPSSGKPINIHAASALEHYDRGEFMGGCQDRVPSWVRQSLGGLS